MTVRQLWQLVGRDKPGRWIVIVVLAVAVTGVEMLGTVLVFVLMSLLVDPGGAISIPPIGDVQRFFGTFDEPSLLYAVVGVVGGFLVLRGIVRVGAAYVEGRVTYRAGARLSSDLLASYVNWPYAIHLQRGSGDLIRNCHQLVIELVADVLLPTVKIVAESLVVIGLLVVLLVVSPQATAIAVVVVAGAGVALLRVVQPKLKRLGDGYVAQSGATLQTIQQVLHGIRDVKVLGREGFFVSHYAVGRLSMARYRYLRHTIAQLPLIVFETAIIGSLLVYILFALATGIAGAQMLATLGLFAYAGLRLVTPLRYIVNGLNNVRFGGPAVAEIYADLSWSGRPVQELAWVADRSQEPFQFTGSLELSDVSFRHEGASKNSLSDVNLTIHRGEHIGICGPTGGGKSTLVDLIVGLIEPTSGEVLVNGYPLGQQLSAWRTVIGFVPQTVFLLDDTIRANIALGALDVDIDAPAVERALRQAELADFVAALPEGMNTQVGERGMRISGGERQRIAIARALYRDPQVLVLDEATSNLDQATEASLNKTLVRMAGGRTIISVAHRLKSLERCDRIISVQQGRVTTVTPGEFAQDGPSGRFISARGPDKKTEGIDHGD